MKKLILILALVMVVLAPVLSHADDGAPLGKGTISFKFGYVSFSDAPDDANDGLYIGLEAYGRVFPNVYLGAGVASASTAEVLSTEDTALVPIELNVKYAKEVHENLMLDAGAGLSYSYASYTENFLFTPDREENGWLFGGQIFGDMIYKINWFTLGIDAKYQITEELEAVGFDFSNFRLGFQLGAKF